MLSKLVNNSNHLKDSYMLPAHHIFLLIICCTAQISVSTAQSIRFVKVVASGNGSGTSWENASSSLQAMVDVVSPVSGTVLVAGGLYKPSINSNRNDSFDIKSGVSVVGGCIGTEQNPDSCPITMPSSTTFSGDIGVPNVVVDNSLHVVVFQNVNAQTYLKNVVISDGYADDGFFPSNVGAGIYNTSLYNGGISSPNVYNCHIVNNYAREGVGLYNYGYYSPDVSPVIKNCLFENNQTYTVGAAIRNDGFASKANMKILDSKFIKNIAKEAGGAVFNQASYGGENHIMITNCYFIKNRASHAGALLNAGIRCRPIITNCVFSKNVSNAYGGAILNTGGSGYYDPTLGCRPIITNCSFSQNSALSASNGFGGAIYSEKGFDGGFCVPIIKNCIVWGNYSRARSELQIFNFNSTTTITFSDVQNLIYLTECVSCSNNIDVNPSFVDSENDDLRLTATSPAVDAGEGNNVSLNGMLDIEGNDRLAGCRVDLGAYELPSTTARSVQTLKDGNWNDASIWNCGNVPQTGDVVSIAHRVVIPSGIIANTALINIRKAGKLVYAPAGKLLIGY